MFDKTAQLPPEQHGNPYNALSRIFSCSIDSEQPLAGREATSHEAIFSLTHRDTSVLGRTGGKLPLFLLEPDISVLERIIVANTTFYIASHHVITSTFRHSATTTCISMVRHIE